MVHGVEVEGVVAEVKIGGDLVRCLKIHPSASSTCHYTISFVINIKLNQLVEASTLYFSNYISLLAHHWERGLSSLPEVCMSGVIQVIVQPSMPCLHDMYQSNEVCIFRRYVTKCKHGQFLMVRYDRRCTVHCWLL